MQLIWPNLAGNGDLTSDFIILCRGKIVPYGDLAGYADNFNNRAKKRELRI
jgi:hypothetical protein